MFKVWFVMFKLVYYNEPYAMLNIVRYTNTLQSFSLFNDKCSCSFVLFQYLTNRIVNAFNKTK